MGVAENGLDFTRDPDAPEPDGPPGGDDSELAVGNGELPEGGESQREAGSPEDYGASPGEDYDDG